MSDILNGSINNIILQQLVKERSSSGTDGKLIGFAHFRFTVQGEVLDEMRGDLSLFLWDIHIVESAQRKCLGKHLLTLLELIARREKMRVLCIPVQLNDEETLRWIAKMKGYSPDMLLKETFDFDAEMEGFEVYSKSLVPPIPKATGAAMSTPTKAKIVVEVASPTGIVDALIEPSVGVSDDNEGENEIRMEDIDEHDIINGLKSMFIERNGRTPTEEEANLWLTSIRQVELIPIFFDFQKLLIHQSYVLNILSGQVGDPQCRNCCRFFFYDCSR